MEYPTQVINETLPLGLTEHLLHKTTLPRLGDIADLTNTQKQKEAAKIGRQGYVCQMKEQEIIPEKDLNEIEETSHQIEFKTMLRRMLKELSGRMGEISENLKR